MIYYVFEEVPELFCKEILISNLRDVERVDGYVIKNENTLQKVSNRCCL